MFDAYPGTNKLTAWKKPPDFFTLKGIPMPRLLTRMNTPVLNERLIPIAYSMAWPDRMNAHVDRLDLTAMDNLNFFKPDLNKFPALNLARFALETGGTAPCVINAANEVAVDAFLQDKIEFLDITRLIDRVLGKYSSRADFKTEMSTIEEVISKDNEVRKVATENIKKLMRDSYLAPVQ